MSEDNILHLPNSNVIPLDVETTVTIPVDTVLNAAIEFGLKEVLVIGTIEDGSFFFSSSSADLRDISWMLTNLQNKLLNGELT